jgi:hypothetical protein
VTRWLRLPSWLIALTHLSVYLLPAIAAAVVVVFDGLPRRNVAEIVVIGAVAAGYAAMTIRRAVLLHRRGDTAARAALARILAAMTGPGMWVNDDAGMAFDVSRTRIAGIPCVVIIRVPESDLRTIDAEGDGFVIPATFAIFPAGARVMIFLNAYRTADSEYGFEPVRPRPRTAREWVAELRHNDRVIRKGAAFADAREVTELAAQLEAAEPVARGD